MRWRDGRLIENCGGPEPILAGWGVFTSAGCDDGRPMLWDRHRIRLQASAEFLGAGAEILVPDEAEISAYLSAARIDGPARFRVVFRMGGDGRWVVEASAETCTAVGPGLAPVLLSVDRWNAAPPLAGHKTLSRLPWDLARSMAAAAGLDDALLVDRGGNLLETSVANVWVVRDGVARTPPAPARCLPGVMRGWLLDNLHAAGIRTEEGDLDLCEIDEADEVWLSNALVGLRRVSATPDRSWDSWPLFDRIEAIGVPAPGWPGPA